jgi:hypothetical protein
MIQMMLLRNGADVIREATDNICVKRMSAHCRHTYQFLGTPRTVLLETSAFLCAGVRPLEVQRLSLFLFLSASDTLQKRTF